MVLVRRPLTEKRKAPPRRVHSRMRNSTPQPTFAPWTNTVLPLPNCSSKKNSADLDCLADAARAGKTRFSGGGWKLRNIYIGLDSPQPGHPTQEDWLRHMELVQLWGKRNPSSVAAPIALAESYASYAWDARGDGFSNSVSESGWKLFGERMAKAKAILDENSALASKCPDWYITMQKVAQGQSWELPQATALLEQAIKFEPEYSY